MTNRLIAVTLGAVLALPTAAFADLTLYGKAHISVDNSDDGTDSGVFVASNSSRLGVKGSTDFGQGVTGVFQLESGVSATGEGTNDGNGGANSGGQLFSRARDSYAGIKGGFGTVIAGRLPAANQWLYDANLFADQVGDVGSFTGAQYPGRADGALHYITPAFGGLSAALTYVPENSTATTAEDSTGIALRFATGGLSLAGYLFEFGDGSTAENKKAAVVSAGFTFGGGHVVQALYQQNSNEDNVSGRDRTIWTVGAGFKLGDGMLKAQYTNADAADNVPDSGATGWAIGFDYSLSKNATVYIAYATVDNDPNASFSATNWGHGKDVGVAAPGKDPSSISIGFVYDFSKTW